MRIEDRIAKQLFKLMWRYRSELVPFGVMLSVLVLVWLFRVFFQPEWYLMWVVAAVGSAAIYCTHRFGKSIPRYHCVLGIATLVVGGSWISDSVRFGHFERWWWLGLAGVTLFLGYFWWKHHHRRTKVKMNRKLEDWPQKCAAFGLPKSRVQSVIVDEHGGWKARVYMAMGQTIDDARKNLPKIEAVLHLHRGTARILTTEDNLAHVFELQVVKKGVHTATMCWEGPSATTITKPITLGPFEDGSPAEVSFLHQHALIGGTTGSGKSNALNVLMGNFAACEDVVIWAADLKGGMELTPWGSCINRLTTTPEATRELLADAEKILTARAALLADQSKRLWEPSPEMPAIVLIVDEYAKLDKAAKDSADNIACQGRAVAITLIASTQRPTQVTMGQGAARSQMEIRICFRVRERKDADLIMGTGMLADGWNANVLRDQGKFMISSAEHHDPARARTYLMTDKQVRMTAKEYSVSRPELDAVSLAAISDGGVVPVAPALVMSASDTKLMNLLMLSPDGISTAALIGGTGMSKPWVHMKLKDMLFDGTIERVKHGTYRMAGKSNPEAAESLESLESKV